MVAKLKESPPPPLSAPVYASPPANLRPPVIVVGQIVLDEKTDKTSRDGWYVVGIEAAVQGSSPDELDTLSDWIEERLEGTALPSTLAQLSRPAIIGEADDSERDAPGGALLVRTQQFRIFAGEL